MALVEGESRFQVVLPAPSKIFMPGVVTLLVLMVAGYVLSIFAPDFTSNQLFLHPNDIKTLSLWQLLTYSFINPVGMILLFDCIIVLFIGSLIEREWRTRSFLMLWAVVSVISGLAWVLASWMLKTEYLGFGSSACTYGLIAAFGLIFRRRRFMVYFSTIEAQTIAWILIAMGIILSIKPPILLVWVIGAVAGYLYVKLQWCLPARTSPKTASNRRPGPFVEID